MDDRRQETEDRRRGEKPVIRLPSPVVCQLPSVV